MHRAEVWQDRFGKTRTTCQECEEDWPCPDARRPEPGPARRTPLSSVRVAGCHWCGPPNPSTGICPSCRLDPGERRYVDLILEVGGDEVYRRECEAARVQRERRAG